MSYNLSPKTFLTFGVDRDFDSSGSGGVIEDTIFSSGIVWNYSPYLQLQNRLKYIHSDFAKNGSAGSAREDETYIAGINLLYSPNSIITYGAGYSLDLNDSSIAAADYESHSISLTMDVRY